MEGDGANDQRQLQTQFGRPRNINTNLWGQEDVLVTSAQNQRGKRRLDFLRTKAVVNWAHLEHVLYFDDAALQDGGTHRWNLDSATVPRLPASGAHNVPAQGAHDRALLLHGAAGDERLCLSDVGFGHHWSGGSVVELGKDRYHLTCGEGESVRQGRYF